MKNTFFIIAGITPLILSPFALIWSINTLFDLGINHDFKTWLAGAFLLLLLGNKIKPWKWLLSELDQFEILKKRFRIETK